LPSVHPLSSFSRVHHLLLHPFPTRRSFRSDKCSQTFSNILDFHNSPDEQEHRCYCRNSKNHKNKQGLPQSLYNAVNRRSANDQEDRKSTRLHSSHVSSSYAVFCLNKKVKDV